MFKNRYHAGLLLAEQLEKEKFIHPYILAIPRGGVIVADPVAEKLNTPLHILVIRKIGYPKQPEVAVGAIMPDGSTILNEYAAAKITASTLQKVIEEEYTELRRRQVFYPNLVKPEAVAGTTTIIIDDGIATGYTIQAAIKWLKTLSPFKVVIASPVAPSDVLQNLKTVADQVICLAEPEPFWAVGQFYEDFSQVSDQEVLTILERTT